MAGYLVRTRAQLNLPKFELSVWIVNPCFVPGLKPFKLDTYNGIGTWNFTNILHQEGTFINTKEFLTHSLSRKPFKFVLVYRNTVFSLIFSAILLIACKLYTPSTVLTKS